MAHTNGETESADDARHRRPDAWAWSICGMLFLATVLNYLDRQTLSVCAPLVCDEFQLSDEQYGSLVSAFRWAYAALHIPAGYLADRLSIRAIYGWSVAFWSVAGASTALVGNFASMRFSRAALGLGEAFNWPCALRVTANILPPADRALGNGVFQSGTAIGALIAPLVIAPLAVRWGWRSPFLVVGALGGVWVVAWLILTSGTARNRLHPSNANSLQNGLADVLWKTWSLFCMPGFWLLLVAGSTINPCWYFLAEWLSKYLHDQHQFDILGAGLATTPIFLGADLGNLGGGLFVKLLTTRGLRVSSARSATAIFGALLATLAAFATGVESTMLCVALLGASAFGIAILMSNWLSCIQALAFDDVGLAMGLLGCFGCVVGATVNPWIGWSVDQSGRYDLVFLLLGVLPLVTLICILLFNSFRIARHEA